MLTAGHTIGSLIVRALPSGKQIRLARFHIAEQGLTGFQEGHSGMAHMSANRLKMQAVCIYSRSNSSRITLLQMLTGPSHATMPSVDDLTAHIITRECDVYCALRTDTAATLCTIVNHEYIMIRVSRSSLWLQKQALSRALTNERRYSSHMLMPVLMLTLWGRR